MEDAFKGREPPHEIHSRLLNPTSISLANHIVDIECGPRAHEYMAWNFYSGMAAIDGLFSHLLGVRDIVLSSRNVYGGTYQLLEDWFGNPARMKTSILTSPECSVIGEERTRMDRTISKPRPSSGVPRR